MKKLSITILKIVVFFIGWIVLLGSIDIPSSQPAIWRFFAEIIPLVALLLFTVVFYLIEKKSISIPIKENIGKGTLTGIVTGALWIGAASSILLISKQLEITGKNEVSHLWLWILSAFLNVIMQELLVRGYIYQLLKKQYFCGRNRDNGDFYFATRRSIRSGHHSGHQCCCDESFCDSVI